MASIPDRDPVNEAERLAREVIHELREIVALFTHHRHVLAHAARFVASTVVAPVRGGPDARDLALQLGRLSDTSADIEALLGGAS